MFCKLLGHKYRSHGMLWNDNGRIFQKAYCDRCGKSKVFNLAQYVKAADEYSKKSTGIKVHGGGAVSIDYSEKPDGKPEDYLK